MKQRGVFKMKQRVSNRDKYINVEQELKKLSKQFKGIIDQDEIEELSRVYQELKHTGKRKAKLIHDIVPIEEWVDSEYYLGREVHNIFPYWKEKMVEIHNSDYKVNQVIVTGSIGIGKTTFAAMLLLRRIYELSAYENVAALFRLMGVSKIAFAYLSVTKEQAEHSGFTFLKEWIDAIPYFQDHFPRHNKLDSLIVFPQENMFVLFGSVANHFIGMNVIGSVLDEANFFEGRQTDDANMKMNNKVSNLYSQIINRAQSRFVIDGVNHSLSVLVSSTTVESSFTEQMIEESKDDPHTVVISPSLWDVKPWNYKGEKFLVYAGGDGFDPYIINDLDDINQLLEANKLNPIYNTTIFEAYKQVPYDIQRRIIEVPVEHRQAFQGDIIIALQDLAGYSVSASAKFFQNNQAYNKAITEDIVHPFSHREIVLSTTDSSFQEGFLPVKDYIKPGFEFKDKHKPRYIHLDLALTGDSVGISMGHISGTKSLVDENREYIHNADDLDNYVVEAQHQLPVIDIDFMLRINPPKKPHKIAFSKIRDFLIYLRNDMGVNIELITADQFQSVMLLQELEEIGFNTGYLSVDRTADAYNSLASFLYENRINMYHYEKFYQELFNLVSYPAKRKIDHPPKGSKDVSDAVAGVVHNIVKAEDKTDLRGSGMTDLYIIANTDEHSQAFIEDKAKQIGLAMLGMGNIKIL